MGWLGAGWGRAGWWGGGVGGSAAPSPVKRYTCARLRAWGSPATAGAAEKKGTETETGTGAGGKILVFGAGEQRSAKEQPRHWEQLLLGSTLPSLQPLGESAAFAVFLILVGILHTMERGAFTAVHLILQ